MNVFLVGVICMCCVCFTLYMLLGVLLSEFFDVWYFKAAVSFLLSATFLSVGGR